ncbi:MAG: ATP-dependent RecD-like DNA helicase, partial [Bacteroidia bacterium]|nr:ATP-dependent RecD-like DNA helicase [Bacteroidia bacterium]
FGGVQLVVFGDLFQLPPVVSSTFERQLIKEKYGNPYFFSAQVFKEIDLRMIELRTVYRQTERRFINLLDSIRLQQLDYDILEEINSRYSEKIPEDIAITLCSTNATVNAINNEKLKALVSPLFEYTAKLSGEFNQRLSPADAHLWLKEGAQVMFVKNDPEGQFVNGTLGQITSLAQDEIIVSILKEGEVKYINVDRVDWEMLRYEIDPENKDKFKTRVTGTFTQYPLKLAWAITIHKSQGKTFDNIIIDLGKGAFDYGQTYVAMSRCRTMEGITLKKKITPRDIMVDQAVIEYYDYKIRNW